MILVLGIPRSGTSAVAGVLHHLGVDMGESVSANEWNAKGFHHDMHFEGHISKLLKYPFPKFNDFVSCPEITVLAKTKSGLWGLKSNRMVYCLPSLVAGVDEIKIITTSRPLEESVDSYSARGKMTKEYSALQINNVNDAIQKVVKPDLVVPFHGLMDESTVWVERIAEIACVPVKQEAIDWIDSSMRRFPR